MARMRAIGPEAREAEGAWERPRERDHLDRARDEERCVKNAHHAEVPLPHLNAASGEGARGVPSRQGELSEALED